MMKKLLALLLACALVFSLTACSDGADDEAVTTAATESTEAEEPEETEAEEPDEEPSETEPEEPVEEPVEAEPNPEFIAELVKDIPMTADTIDAYLPEDGSVTYNEDGSVSANVSSISFNVEDIYFGESSVIYIKGTAATESSVMVKYGNSYADGFENVSGDFEYYIQYDQGVDTESEGIPTGTGYVEISTDDGAAADITITELAFYNGTLDDYKADVEWFANAPAELFATYDETKFTAIPVTQDSFGRAQIVNSPIEVDDAALEWTDDGLTINGATLVAFKLPSGVGMGNTIVVHIKGASDNNFRLWLLDEVEVTASRQIDMNEYFRFNSGEYDYLIELTTEYVDAEIANDTALQLAFKALSWDTTLDGLTINELGVYYGTLEDYMAGVESNPDAALQPVAEDADDTAEDTTDDATEDTTDDATTDQDAEDAQ